MEESNKPCIAIKKEQDRVDDNELCTSPVELEFKKMDVRTNTFKEGYNPYKLTFTPLPGDIETKKKHYYIFFEGNELGETVQY